MVQELYNLEDDLKTSEWIVEKVQNSEIYAQNLYAALCNNRFVKNEVLPILKEESWGCSWRYAGGIISDIRQEGDYLDWYCSGIGTKGSKNTGYVNESYVVEEIAKDLLKLGWIIIETPYPE